MKLKFGLVEDWESENMRTTSEQALLPGKGYLIRTTIERGDVVAVSLVYVPGEGTEQERFAVPE